MKTILRIALTLLLCFAAKAQAQTAVACYKPVNASQSIIMPGGTIFSAAAPAGLSVCSGATACRVVVSPNLSQLWPGGQMSYSDVSALRQCTTSDTTVASGGGSGTLTSVNGDTGPDVVITAASLGAATTGALTTETSARTTADGLLVPKTTTVNGHALSGNVTVTAADAGAAVASDITTAISTEVTNRNSAITTAVGTETSARTTADGLLVPKTTTVNGHALNGNVTVTAADAGAATASDITAAKTILHSTCSITGSSLATLTEESGSPVTITGAVLGNEVTDLSATDGTHQAGVLVYAFVTSTNTVTCYRYNTKATSQTTSTKTYNFSVVQ